MIPWPRSAGITVGRFFNKDGSGRPFVGILDFQLMLKQTITADVAWFIQCSCAPSFAAKHEKALLGTYLDAFEGFLGEKIDREMFSATPEYKFYYEGDLNPFPDMKATGSFLDRKYTFTSGSGDVIARVGRDFEFIKDVDTYQVDVAAGVDAAAILAMAVVIDEDHDEKDAKEEREKEEKGGWPFG